MNQSPFFQKKIFVSGGAGVIGTALVNKLLLEGADLFIGDLKPCPESWRGKLKYRRGDLVHIPPEELIEFSPEIVFHLAATFERSTETRPFYEENFHHNILLSHRLMEALQLCSSLKKLVFASSYLIYDPQLYTFQTPQSSAVSLKEDSPVFPRNICGAAKYFHESELQFFKQFLPTVSFISARIFRVYGYGSKDIISRWVREAIEGKPLNVYSKENIFDYIFADDVAEGLQRLSNTKFSGIINLGSGSSRSVSDVLTILKQHIPEVKTEEVNVGVPYEASQAEMNHCFSLTQWKPAHRLEDAIPKLIAYEKSKREENAQTKMSNILITSVSKKTPLVQAVRDAAKKIGSVGDIHGCDSNKDCIGKYCVDQFWNCPPFPTLTRDIIIDYCKKYHIQFIVPTRDGELPFFAEHRPFFASLGIQVMVSDPKAIRTCLDKMEFYEVLRKNGLPGIRTALSLEELEADRIVVKERYGAGSHGLRLDLTREQARTVSKELKSPIFQPFVSGREYSVDLYRDLTGKVKGGVARERNLVIHGESQVTTTLRKPELESLCTAVAHILGLYGPVVFQALEADNQYYLIECNPRFGGASTASLAVGLDSFYWFLLESQKENLDAYPFHRKAKEIRQIRHPTDWIQEVL